MTVNRKFPLLKVGQKVNLWTVRKITLNEKGAVVTLICECSCGAYKVRTYASIRGGHSKSCSDCGRASSGIEKRRYVDIVPDHRIRARLLTKIHSAYNRCNNKKRSGYENYGGRGITVKFLDVESFLKHLVSLPGHDDPTLTLDRIKNDKHYEKGNLRFASRSEQEANKRNSPVINS